LKSTRVIKHVVLQEPPNEALIPFQYSIEINTALLWRWLECHLSNQSFNILLKSTKRGLSTQWGAMNTMFFQYSIEINIVMFTTGVR
jgi:hypothetical protein